MFSHKDIYKITWTSPDNQTNNQIDHICVSRRWRSSLLDVCSQKGADMYTDHNLLCGYMRIKLLSNKRRKNAIKRKLNIEMLQDENTATRFLPELDNQLKGNLNETDGIGEKCTKLVDIMSTAGESILGYKDRERSKWISIETWNLITERKNVKLQISATHGEGKQQLFKTYHESDKKVSESARKDKRKWIDKHHNLNAIDC